MNNDSEYVLVMTTVDDLDRAAILASALVEAHLAACVQRMPIESTYRWEGSIEVGKEFLLLIKTTTERAQDIVHYIRNHHPYETPEIVIIPIMGGSEAYLHWVKAETQPEAPI